MQLMHKIASFECFCTMQTVREFRTVSFGVGKADRIVGTITQYSWETAVAQMKAEAKTMLANKQESIERLEKELAGSQKYNKALAERLKVVRELMSTTHLTWQR